MTYREALFQAAARLKNAGVEGGRFEAELLLAHVLRIERVRLLSSSETAVARADLSRFQELVRLRSTRVPLAYLVGTRHFLDLVLEVGPGVLIPRPETELLVEVAADLIEKKCHQTVVDLGTGSGAIAIALARSVESGRFVACEISEQAVSIASRNIARWAAQVELLHMDAFAFLAQSAEQSLDLVVSNPPYVPTLEIDLLQPEVARYEPRAALDGGSDGLQFIRKLVTCALPRVRPGGSIALEVGAGQAACVAELLADAGWQEIAINRDLSGIERVVRAKSPARHAGWVDLTADGPDLR